MALTISHVGQAELERYVCGAEHGPAAFRNMAVALLSFAFHVHIFRTVKAPPGRKKPLQLKAMYVSTVHSVVVLLAFFAWLSTFKFGMFEFERSILAGVKGTGDEYMAYAMSYSLGYFLYDTFYMFVYPEELASVGSAIHHAMMITGFAMGLTLHGSVTHPMHFYFLLEELSTPFLNMKGIYADHPGLYKFSALAFMATFFLSRFVWGSFCYYATMSQYFTDPRFAALLENSYCRFQWWTCIMLATLSRVLNTYWLYYILRKLMEYMREGTDKAAKKRVEGGLQLQNGAADNGVRRKKEE